MSTLKKISAYIIMAIIVTIGFIGLHKYTQTTNLSIYDLGYFALAMIIIWPVTDYWLKKVNSWLNWSAGINIKNKIKNE